MAGLGEIGSRSEGGDLDPGRGRRRLERGEGEDRLDLTAELAEAAPLREAQGGRVVALDASPGVRES